MKKICIIKVGNIIAGLIDVITLGRGLDLAGFIAIKLLGKQSCGCQERKSKLNAFFGCPDGIKL